MTILNWFDGKKTTIGAVLLFIATVGTEVIVGKWNYSPEWMQPTIETLNWLGMAFTGLGLGHKAIKFSPTDKTPE